MNSFTTLFSLSILFLISRQKGQALLHERPHNFSYKPISSTGLFSTPPRQPRRLLKKRKRRQRVGRQIAAEDPFPWDTAESRPLVASVSKEAGEDYWIDEKDLEAERMRQLAIKNRKAMEGEVSKEKLWSEVKAPYKQNWIGYFSVAIATLSVIIIKFPELLDTPQIQIPDL